MNLSMINQARELKSKLDKAQKELSDTIIEVSSSRGAVKITINGQQEIKSIKISPEVINPDKAEKLEELVFKAVNEAVTKSQKVAAKQLKGLTGGLKIPGLF
ncbi:MAG TPA: YbaB/EbfC family nucleoid-associated protein [Dehalococcoidia bacterium]|jgi:DNA-binding YbaB/EbfC family protein|nr:YbaB/EbfC family nucleoid-associated protein [Dehalococcoidia bacterium]